jgi:hypothetical protein
LGNLFEDVEPTPLGRMIGGYTVPQFDGASGMPVHDEVVIPDRVRWCRGDRVRCVSRGHNVNITAGRTYVVDAVEELPNPGFNTVYHRCLIDNDRGVRRWYRSECFERVGSMPDCA